jgi:hypothetical protein
MSEHEPTRTFLAGGARLRTAPYRALIHAVSGLDRLPDWDGFDIGPGFAVQPPYSGDEWLEALILTESNGNTLARRYEEHLDRPVSWQEERDTVRKDDGVTEDDASYGLMQVMGWNAREFVGLPPVPQGGPYMSFVWLYDALAGIAAGMYILRNCLRREPGVAMALARYNGGARWADREASGMLRGHAYVSKVWARCALVREDRGRDIR